MMLNKKSFKKILLSVSVAAALSSPALAQDQKISALKESISGSHGSTYVTDQDFKKAMEDLVKKQALMEREAKLEELKGKGEKEKNEPEPEKTLAEKMNPPINAEEVSIEYFGMMEKKYQSHLLDLRNEVDSLKERIIELKNPSNAEVIQNHIYVTEVYAFGDNKYATVMWDFHFFKDVTEGEEVIPGVTISKINDKGVGIVKSDGSKHFIYKVSKRRALENAYSKKKDPELEYLNIRNQANSPGDIQIRSPMSSGLPRFGGGGSDDPLQIFPQ